MYYNVCVWGKEGDHNRRMFFVHIAYILLVSSGMNPRAERRAMVLEAANGGGLCHPGSGRGCPPSCEQNRSPEESLLKGSYF